MNELVVIPIVLLAFATGFCRGVLEQIHPLNKEFRHLTILMMYIFATTLLLCSALGLIHGR